MIALTALIVTLAALGAWDAYKCVRFIRSGQIRGRRIQMTEAPILYGVWIAVLASATAVPLLMTVFATSVAIAGQ